MMKRLIAMALALMLCLATVTVAHASNHDYAGLKNCYIRRRGSQGTEVRRIQQALVTMGYLNDKVDGSYGARTESAVWEFQRKNGITPSGVATMFTQAVLFGTDAMYAWNNNKRLNTSSGDYGVRNVKVYRSGNTFDVSFDFVNQDSQNVEAICIYYWMDTGKGRLVYMNKNDFYMHWYYDYNTPRYGTIHVKSSLSVNSSEMKKAHELRCIIGEIGYTNGSVVVCMNASRQPYEGSYYLLHSW